VVLSSLSFSFIKFLSATLEFGINLLQVIIYKIIVCDTFNPCDFLVISIQLHLLINFGVPNLACFLIVSNIWVFRNYMHRMGMKCTKPL
jgi:hypothetical protein